MCAPTTRVLPRKTHSRESDWARERQNRDATRNSCQSIPVAGNMVLYVEDPKRLHQKTSTSDKKSATL